MNEDKKSGRTRASACGARFAVSLPVTFDITIRDRCEDIDQPAAGPEHVQRARHGGGSYGVQDDINAFS